MIFEDLFLTIRKGREFFKHNTLLLVLLLLKAFRDNLNLLQNAIFVGILPKVFEAMI